MPNEEWGGDSGNSNNNGNNNTGDNTVDPGDDKVESKANIIRSMMPDSLNGSSYSKNSQNNTYIVIHNTAGGTASSNTTFFHNGADGRRVCTHYVVDDKEIYQLLENNWKGTHCGDAKDSAHSSSPMGNNNTIGIEVADGDSVDHAKAVEVVIELTRHLMKQMNIDIDHVVRHHDVSGKQCPATIMGMTIDGQNGWDYIKSEIKRRNEANEPIQLDTSLLSSNGSVSYNNPHGGTPGSSDDVYSHIGPCEQHYNGNVTFLDILPNQDHRFNIANMEQVTGACIIFLPPYNVCHMSEMESHFATWNNWDRTYHYLLDSSYDIDANPDDDIPDLSQAKGLDEMGTVGDDPDNESGGDSNSDNDSDGDYVDPDELPEDNRQVRRPLGPDDVGTTNPDTGDSGDAGDNIGSASFIDAIFVGDSLTVGLGQTVKDITTYATVGHTVSQGRSAHMQSIINSGAKVVILSYGTNDAASSASTEKFISGYESFINDIKEGIPGVRIFVNKIFPGDSSKAASPGYNAAIKNIPAFNEALDRICLDTGATLVDCTDIPNLTSYYTDGIHFKPEFYELWYDDMNTKISRFLEEGSYPGQTEVVGPAPVEDTSIVIKGGFLIDKSRLLQCEGLADNDKATYISRSLYNSRPQAHCIMIACFIPSHDQLVADQITYSKVERNIINSVSKILWANGLEAKDLWREFDMNRMPSPAQYLDRDTWKDLLFEIDKQVEWRNKKFGKVTATYEKYVAVIPDQTIYGGTGSGGGGGGGTNEGSLVSSNEVANKIYEYFTGQGYSSAAACGIIGNVAQESGFKPNAENPSSGAYGLFQWLHDRKTNFLNHLKSKGTDINDVTAQCEWAHMECEGKDPATVSQMKKRCGGLAGFKSLNSVEEAVKYWRLCFERCGEGEANDSNRINKAKEYYNQINKSDNSTTPETPEASDTPATASVYSRTIQTRSAQFSWPTPGITRVSSKFGPRVPPCPGASDYHGGIDIAAPSGTDVHATAGGTVTLCTYHDKAGNYIVIDHGNGWGSRYLHLDKFLVKKGDTVTANQVIAKSGATGIGTGAHLHFELQNPFPAGGTSGTKVDPLLYVEADVVVDNPGGGSSSGGTSGGTSSGSSVTGALVNSIWGDITNPGPAANLPYNGNSMGGLEHSEWGGKMNYFVGDPTDSEAIKPEIGVVLADYQWQQFCEKYFIDEAFNSDGTSQQVVNFNKFWQLMDNDAGEIEPYDKGLVNASDATITPNDRLNALTTTFTTDNENVFHFNIIESGPGSKDHSVKAADELNYVVTPTDLRVEPIYPDLIIPPQYSTTDYDKNSSNTIPLSLIQETTGEDTFNKQLSFNYDVLKDVKKETKKCFGPINFMDPYPTDDKIEELEQHYPKVFIDEIEAQLYSCNHPGCPIAQPMAKNFAMLSDALMNQSKRVEKRLVRLENVLSTIMRNQARLSSRININCVYYGGQSTYAGKYKCIRCMHDDRIHDGAIVTLDQCLNCTRYEPILGQVYQILDESGFNGSIVLDDMQMSYSDLDTYRRLNIQSEASPKYSYVSANDDNVGAKHEKDLIELWKDANKELYLKSLPETQAVELTAPEDAEGTGDDLASQETVSNDGTLTNQETVSNNINQPFDESSYIFRMNWNETFLNSQQPDTKQYPTEGIIMRFKKQEGDYSFSEEIRELDPELDKDTISDLQKQIKILNGQWSDTREIAETVQINKYSSEKFYFKGFAEIKHSNGLTGSGGSGGLTGGIAAECRKKICEMAETIVKECTDGKAWYSQTNRTVDYNQPGYHNGKKAYDCSGFVSCCYLHAGLKSMYAKSCGQGTLMEEIVNNGGEMWLMDEAGFEKAKPGDVIVVATGPVDQSDMGTKVPIEHAIIYMGDRTIAHARNSKKGIVKEPIEDWRIRDKDHIFVRPKDLIDADAAAAAAGSSGGVTETEGEVDGKKYVARILGAVCTSYTGSGAGASGMGCEYNKTCASHNLPYGTKIYIPQLADKLGGDGILTVTDTGGPLFDFDIFTTSNIGKVNADVYVLEWGTGKVAKGYTYFIDYYLKNGQWNDSSHNYKKAWNVYKEMGGKLMTFLKFSQEDANLTSHPNYNDK